MNKIKKIKITYVYITALVVILIVAAILFFSLQSTVTSFEQMEKNIDQYNLDRDAFDDVKEASSYLTNEARYYVATSEKKHLENYFNEARVVKRRDNALATIKASEGESELYRMIENSANTSNELMKTEIYAFELAADAYGTDLSDLHLEEYGVTISEEDRALPKEEKINKAVSLLFDDEYIRMKSIIEDNVYEGVSDIVDNTRTEKDARTAQTHRLLVREHVLMIILTVLMVLTVLLTIFLLILPIRRNIQCIREDQKMPEGAVSELAYLAEAYNSLHDERTSNISQLSYEASHDSLTGLLNRKVFEEKIEQLDDEDDALMLVDVDYFKEINDTYGHDVGDIVLKKVADVMTHSFRSNDLVFRLGGDEFAVILLNMRHEYKEVLLMKIQKMRDLLAVEDNAPKVTLSIGIAFRADPGAEPIYKKADLALYDSKDKGRNTTSFYTPVQDEEGADK